MSVESFEVELFELALTVRSVFTAHPVPIGSAVRTIHATAFSVKQGWPRGSVARLLAVASCFNPVVSL